MMEVIMSFKNKETQATPETQSTQATPGSEGSQEVVVGKAAETNQQIPKHRFDEVNNLMKEYKAKLDEMKAQAELSKTQELEKQQQFEELYRKTQKELEDIKTSKTTVDTKLSEYETVVQQLVEAKLEVAPEELKSLVPSNFTPTQKLEWLNTAERNGLFKKTGPVGAPMNGPTDVAVDVSKMSPTSKMAQAYLKNGTTKTKY